MISQTAEYCLRAVICLAANPGKSLITRQIAEVTKIPPGYLAKVLQSLGRAGIVTAQRGLNGGFVLLRDPQTLTLLEVVRIVDQSSRIATCPLGIHGTALCPLHRQLNNMAAMAEDFLTKTTIANLIASTAANSASPTSGVCSHHTDCQGPCAGDSLCSK